MILQAGIGHFEIIKMGFWANKTGHVVDHKRLVAPRQSVTESFTGGHIDAFVLAVGQLTALASLEVHEIFRLFPQRAACAHSVPCVVEQLDGDIKLISQSSVSTG